MKHLKTISFYFITIGGFTGIILWILHSGKNLQTLTHSAPTASAWDISDALSGNLTHPLSILLLQIASIILVARFLSWICKKIDQPAVIGEIAAGIVLGPSLLGLYFPGFFHALFPESSLTNLQFLSQIGLILFMFVIGMELDLRILKSQANEAVMISHVSIVFPFTLGVGLAWFLYKGFAPAGVPFLSFSLFLGISMSITAFPVLARIVQEKGIHKTFLGTIVITCAAVDDITAWSLLAMVIAIVKAGSFISSMATILMAIAYVIIMLKVIKPFLKRIGDLHASRENLSKPVIAIFFLVLILSSYMTEIIGIHALFGAFMAGVIMPDNQKFRQIIVEKVEDVALVLLLPLFFVYTGLRTQVGLLNEPGLWVVCLLVILVAIVGKFGGSSFAARFSGQSWKDSLTIGALMNTRGLVELVALNIGYDLGVLTPEIFTMLVIMALITTVMTAPALTIIERSYKPKKVHQQDLTTVEPTFNVLISFGNPEMGRILLRLISKLFTVPGKIKITALHLYTGNLFTKFKTDEFEKESFAPIRNEAKKINIDITAKFKVSEDINSDIIGEANTGYDLMLIGIGHSIYEGTLLGRLLGLSAKFLNPVWLINNISSKKMPETINLDTRTSEIISKTKVPVGVLINRGLIDIKNVLLIQTTSNKMVESFTSPFIRQDIQLSILNLSDEVLPVNDLSVFDLIMISPEGWNMIKNDAKIKTARNSVLLMKVRTH